MQRWVTTLAGAAVVVLAVWMVVHNFRPPRAIGTEEAADGAADAHADHDGSLAASVGGGVSGEDSGLLVLSDLPVREMRGDGGAGTTMPDGSPVPSLPLAVPRQIRFGVVLVSYAGAQPGAGGARPSSRSRGDASALAAKLLATADEDFHAAVQQGDWGSADDLGQVKIGILEPAPEYILFTLPVNGVGGPVDTPRGYWIVKRLE
jgi:PPIC-type PPIASE domain